MLVLIDSTWFYDKILPDVYYELLSVLRYIKDRGIYYTPCQYKSL
jgi:hypothetical protein